MCQDGCTLQEVDMDDWITKSALTGLNYTIQGTTYAKGPVISYIEALGLVNNMTFNSQTVLLTHSPQTMNSTVTIGNRLTTNRIHSLTFENMYVNFINDQNVTEFFENLVLKDGIGNDAGEIFSHLAFSDRVNFENLTIKYQINGINMYEIISTKTIFYGTTNIKQKDTTGTNSLN